MKKIVHFFILVLCLALQTSAKPDRYMDPWSHAFSNFKISLQNPGFINFQNPQQDESISLVGVPDNFAPDQVDNTEAVEDVILGDDTDMVPFTFELPSFKDKTPSLNQGNSPNPLDYSAFFNLFKTSQPWFKGPNVCVEREETEAEDDVSVFSYSQRCMEGCGRYECVTKKNEGGVTKTLTERYQCCHGYRRSAETDKCEQIDLYSLLETIKSLNGSEFLKISGDLEEMLTTQNMTVFLPSDEAFQAFINTMLETNQLELNVDAVRRRRSVHGISSVDLLKAHMAQGFHEMYPDEAFKSMYNNSSLKIDRAESEDGRSGFLVNCVKVLSKNHLAINGVVHVVDKVLMPVTKNVLEVIQNKPEYSIFYKYLKNAGLLKTISEAETVTIFAPTNKAFENLPKNVINQLIRGDGCAKNILKNLIVPQQMLCSANIDVMSDEQVHNVNGQHLLLSKSTTSDYMSNAVELDESEAFFYVDNVKVTAVDVVATNGVIHTIEEVLIPDSAVALSTLLERKNLTMFLDVVQRAGMTEEVDSMTNVSYFIPTNDAIESYMTQSIGDGDNEKTVEAILFPTDKEENSSSDSDLRSFVLQHIVPGELKSCDMENNTPKKSMAGSDVNINLFSTMPSFANTYNRATVNCARLLRFDTQQCSNVVHQIDKPLVKAESTLLELVRSKPELSIISEAMRGTKLESILRDSKDITFIAISNDEIVNVDKLSPQQVEYILKTCVINTPMCCAQMMEAMWPFTNTVKSVKGRRLVVRKNQVGALRIDSCDHVASNGILHISNSKPN